MLRWLGGVGVVVALAGVGFVAGGFAARTETGTFPRGSAEIDSSQAPAAAPAPTVRADVVPNARAAAPERGIVPARPVARPAHAGGAPSQPRPADDARAGGVTGGGALPDDRSDTFPDGLPGMSPDDQDEPR
jgi:hypothetical protein